MPKFPDGVGHCRWGLSSRGRCGVCKKFLAERGTARLNFADDGRKRDFWLAWSKADQGKWPRARVFRTVVSAGQTPRDRIALLPGEIDRELRDGSDESKASLRRSKKWATDCLSTGFNFVPASICEIGHWMLGHFTKDAMTLIADPDWVKAVRMVHDAMDEETSPFKNALGRLRERMRKF